MSTPGSLAMRDLHESAIKVVAAFKDRPERDHLHPVQIQCLEDLERTCRLIWDLAAKKDLA